jgi:hypothetical protein
MIFLFRTQEKCVVKFTIVSDGSHRKISHTKKSPLYLFEQIKGRLASASFEERDQLLQAIDVILQSIENATMEHCFKSGWTD